MAPRVPVELISGAEVVEREWREASDMRRSTLTLAVILTAAAILRFWALDAGIPRALGVDEPQIMTRSIQMMRTGSLNPGGFFDYPGLYLYIQMGVACARFLAGSMAGEWRSLNEARAEDFYLWGRRVTALLGTLTVLVVYQIGMRWGSRHALLAAALLAVMPLHVRESHYVLTDVPVTFFVALTFLLALSAHEQPTTRAFAKAGAVAGLAAATKYPGALAIVLPLVAVWMTPGTRPSRLTAALAAIAAAAAAFLIAAPYTLLDLPGFLNGYAKLASGYASIPPPEAGWITYLKHLRLSLHWPGTLLLLAGTVLATVRAVRGPGRVRWMLAVVFPLLYFWFVSRQTLIYARYLLPIVPFVCVLTAAAVVSGVSFLRRFEIPRAARTALIAALTVVVILPPAIQAIGFNRLISRQSTVELTYSWILEHVPNGATVVVETGGLQLPVQYKSSNTPQLRGREFESYRDSGVEYLIASSQAYGPYFAAPHTFPREYAEYMKIFEQSRELVRFSPSDAHPGPELRILKVNP
jgi:4-amino-4-deoxy-L-arabinose transferase-like glycosyltransferase